MSKYQTNKLSDPEIRHTKPTEKLYRLRDGGGLSLDVRPSGNKVWRYAYRINGKQKFQLLKAGQFYIAGDRYGLIGF